MACECDKEDNRPCGAEEGKVSWKLGIDHLQVNCVVQYNLMTEVQLTAFPVPRAMQAISSSRQGSSAYHTRSAETSVRASDLLREMRMEERALQAGGSKCAQFGSVGKHAPSWE